MNQSKFSSVKGGTSSFTSWNSSSHQEVFHRSAFHAVGLGLAVMLVGCSSEAIPEPSGSGGETTHLPPAGGGGGSEYSESGGAAIGGTNATGGALSTGGSNHGEGGSSGGSASQSGEVGEATGGTNGDANFGCEEGNILCEGFESYPLGDAPGGDWSAVSRGSGAVVVDGERAFSGDKSLHVTGKLNADHAYITTPVEDSEVAHVRFMMYTASYPASSGVHTRLALLGLSNAASGSPYTSYSLATYNGLAMERVNSIYLRDTGTRLDDSKLQNRWVCFEFGVDKTGGDGNVKVHIWIDGQNLSLSPAGSSSHGQTSNSWDPVVFEMFMIGLYGYQSDSQLADYWIDDLLVTRDRVGCPAVE